MSLPEDKDESPQLSLKTLEPDEALGEVPEAPEGIGRRELLMRGALIGAVAVITGRAAPAVAAEAAAKAAKKAAPKAASPSLAVVKQSKGPVMTTVDEFYKVGPGPSSSHTIG